MFRQIKIRMEQVETKLFISTSTGHTWYGWHMFTFVVVDLHIHTEFMTFLYPEENTWNSIIIPVLL